VTKTVEVTCR